MKLAVLVLLLSAATSAVGQTHPVSEAHARGFKGSVRTVREEVADVYRAGGTLVEGQRRLSGLESYDSAGRLVSSTRYVNGVAIERNRLVQLDRATVAVETEYRRSDTHFALVSAGTGMSFRDGAGTWRSERALWSIVRDCSGRVVEKVFHASDDDSTAVARERARYDDRARLAETLRLAGDGSELGRDLFSYDATGALVSLDVVSATGEIVERTTYDGYVFDANGNWTRRAEHVRAGPLVTERVVYRTLSYQPPRPRAASRSNVLARGYYPRAYCWMARLAAGNVAGSRTESALVAVATAGSSEKGTLRSPAVVALGNEEKSEARPSVVGASMEVTTIEIVVGRTATPDQPASTDADTEHRDDIDSK